MEYARAYVNEYEKADGIIEFGFDENLNKKNVAECFEITGLRAPLADGTYVKTPEEHEEIPVRQCIAKIDNLKVGQKIYYRCVAGDTSTKIYDFHMAPQSGGKYTFVQMSDLQGLKGCNDTVYKAGCMHPDFILFYEMLHITAGDLIDGLILKKNGKAKKLKKRYSSPVCNRKIVCG